MNLTSFRLRLAQSALTARSYHHRPPAFNPRRFPRSSRMPTGPLNFHAGPLVWIDCEMTGLDPKKDKLMEIAVLITDGNLELVDSGVQFVIHHDQETLSTMDEWCTRTHGQSGLTTACLVSENTRESVQKEVLTYIKKWIPVQRAGVLAGNSVHADRTFLVQEMPEIVDWLHYRIVDVSSIKELCRRWYPQCNIPKIAESNHRALDDIRGSIRELKWYRENIFVDPKSVPQKSPPLQPAKSN